MIPTLKTLAAASGLIALFAFALIYGYLGPACGAAALTGCEDDETRALARWTKNALIVFFTAAAIFAACMIALDRLPA